MKQLKSRISSNLISPQQAMDEIMQLEIELAQDMADAQDKALDKISQAESEMDAIKKDTLVAAREERDRLQREGIASARQAALVHEQEATAAAQQFQAAGEDFVQEAARRVMAIIIPDIKDDQA